MYYNSKDKWAIELKNPSEKAFKRYLVCKKDIIEDSSFLHNASSPLPFRYFIAYYSYSSKQKPILDSQVEYTRIVDSTKFSRSFFGIYNKRGVRVYCIYSIREYGSFFKGLTKYKYLIEKYKSTKYDECFYFDVDSNLRSKGLTNRLRNKKKWLFYTKDNRLEAITYFNIDSSIFRNHHKPVTRLDDLNISEDTRELICWLTRFQMASIYLPDKKEYYELVGCIPNGFLPKGMRSQKDTKLMDYIFK
jgi:hypothetical protein